jgi:glycosyltransferase involved in cell wall biosynthesis
VNFPKRIIYIGNFLTSKKQNPAPHVLLTEAFERKTDVIRSSSKKNLVLRVLDMLLTVWHRNSKDSVVIIDVFSSLAFYYAVCVSALCKVLRRPYFLVLHGGDLPQRYQRSPRLSAVMFSNSYQIISPTRYLKERTESNFPVSVQVISNPLNLELYKATPKAYDAPRILWLRAFHHIYNPQMAIEVLYELKKIYPYASLCMVGPDKDGSMESCKRLVASYHLEDCVEFTGFLEKKVMIEKASTCNVYLNTTQVDNTPVSLLEALALGIPVVSTNVGGIPYLVTNGYDCVLVESNNVPATVDAIKHIMDDVDFRDRLIINGLKNVQKRGVTSVIKQWETLLNGAV